MFRFKAAITATLFAFAPGDLAGSFEVATAVQVLPHGARQCGMGEVGTALADDAHCVFWNPAGLGIRNAALKRKAASSFYERLVPALKLRDLWRMQQSAAMQWDNGGIRGLGTDFHVINFGRSTSTDYEGRQLARFRSSESVLTVAYGYSIADAGFGQSAVGLSCKYIHSALVTDFSEGDARTVAFDAGLLWQMMPAIRLGFTLANMGPAIYYLDKSAADPQPFTLNVALAYRSGSFQDISGLIQFNAEMRMHRVFEKNYINRQPEPFYRALAADWRDKSFRENMEEVECNFGAEVVINNAAALRLGYLIDVAGERFELHLGTGMSLFPGLDIDWYFIHSPEGYMKRVFTRYGSYGVRHGQWGLTASVYGSVFDTGCRK